MPLYDCMLLLKPRVSKEAVIELVARVGKHVFRKNGVLTEVKSFGTVQLGYGIKKLDGRYYQGQLMQMTMMTPPTINDELHYLNKEDRLLRWLLVKHRGVGIGRKFLEEHDNEFGYLSNVRRSILNNDDDDDDVMDESDDDEDDDEYVQDEKTSEGYY